MEMTEELLLAFISVNQAIPQLVEAAKTEEDFASLKTLLPMGLKTHQDAVTAFDKKVDVYRADVEAGKFGDDFETNITRIYEPRGKKAGDTVKPSEPTMEEKLRAAFNLGA